MISCLLEGSFSGMDLSLFKIFREEEGAVEEIQAFYRNYHSSRFVNDDLVIRLHHALNQAHLTKLNQTFQDLLIKGQFTQSSALPKEHDEPDLAMLSRLVFQYNRKDAGRLRQLIDWLNALPE